MRNGQPGGDPIGMPVSAAPRSTKRGLGARLSGGHLLMIVAGLLAFVLTLVLLGDRGATVTVAVASEDLAPGTELTTDVVKPVKVAANSPLVSSLVMYDDVADGPDQFTSRRVSADEPISESAVATKQADANQRVMSIRADSINAVGGNISAGDLVDVLAVITGGVATDGDAPSLSTGGTTSCRVVAGAEVLGVADDSSGGLGGSEDTSGFYVTIAVPQVDQENYIAAAIEGGVIHIVNVTGAPPAEIEKCAAFPGTRVDEQMPGPRTDGATDQS